MDKIFTATLTKILENKSTQYFSITNVFYDITREKFNNSKDNLIEIISRALTSVGEFNEYQHQYFMKYTRLYFEYCYRTYGVSERIFTIESDIDTGELCYENALSTVSFVWNNPFAKSKWLFKLSFHDVNNSKEETNNEKESSVYSEFRPFLPWCKDNGS